MKLYTLAIIITGILLSNCSSKSKKSIVEQLDKNITEKSKPVTLELIQLDEEFIYVNYYFVYRDSLLVVINKRYNDIDFVEFYDLQNKKILKKSFHYGNGPGEVLSLRAQINGSELVVNDYVKGQYASVNLDSIRKNPNYNPKIQKHNAGAAFVTSYKDGKLIMENPFCFASEKLEIDYEAPRFLVSEKDSFQIEFMKYQYYTGNMVLDGNIIKNPKENRIIYASLCFPLIEIYNYKLELIRELEGPRILPIEYRYEDNEICFNQKIPYAFISACSNDKNFYVTYMGDFLTNGKKMYDYPLWLFKFDWNGNIQQSFNIGRYLKTISPSINENFMYGTAFDEDENPILIKIKLA